MLKSRYSYLAFVVTAAAGLGGLAWLAPAAEKPRSAAAPGAPLRTTPRQLTLQPAAPALPELSTQPAPTVKIATVNMRLLFQSFKGSEALQRRAGAMQQQMMESSRSGNQQKMSDLREEFQKLQESAFDEMKAAVSFVAKRDHIDVVVPGEAFVYKDDAITVPDLTRAALDRWNVATTMPTSLPSTEPEEAPAPKIAPAPKLTPSK
jgi:hypothetical protein